MENLRVVLVATRNPLNMGAVARAMSNFGALHLRVVTVGNVGTAGSSSSVTGVVSFREIATKRVTGT